MDTSSETDIRPAAFAGSWYPGNPQQLQRMVDSFLEGTVKTEAAPRAVIAPHAGYVYSGGVAGKAYGLLPASIRRVFLLGPSHRFPLQGVCLASVKAFQTPLGSVQLDPVVRQIAATSQECYLDNQPHREEHSLELQLPFLQRQLDSFTIVPMLIGSLDPSVLAGLLHDLLQPDDCIVVSVDLSHFHAASDAEKLDHQTIAAINSLDAEAVLDQEIDAPWAVAALLRLAARRDWKPYLQQYTHSGRVSGDDSRVVGYASFLFGSG